MTATFIFIFFIPAVCPAAGNFRPFDKPASPTASTVTVVGTSTGVTRSLTAGGAATAKWNKISSPHFEVFHESNWAPTGISVDLERIHSAMRMDLSAFVPWMTKEKVKIYIYASSSSYVSGEFSPPAWSRGMAYTGEKIVAVYDDGKRENLVSVLAHELTHLFFESFFGEKKKTPPAWLNEGLAVKMEDASSGLKTGVWASALTHFPADKAGDFSRHLVNGVSENASAQEAADWYLVSYGIVRFLSEGARRLKFQDFCFSLRKGEKVEEALWQSYRYRSVKDLQAEWTKWLGTLQSSKDGGGNSAYRFTPILFKPFSTGTR